MAEIDGSVRDAPTAIFEFCRKLMFKKRIVLRAAIVAALTLTTGVMANVIGQSGVLKVRVENIADKGGVLEPSRDRYHGRTHQGNGARVLPAFLYL